VAVARWAGGGGAAFVVVRGRTVARGLGFGVGVALRVAVAVAIVVVVELGVVALELLAGAEVVASGDFASPPHPASSTTAATSVAALAVERLVIGITGRSAGSREGTSGRPTAAPGW
jgi:hypothetical protein